MAPRPRLFAKCGTAYLRRGPDCLADQIESSKRGRGTANMASNAVHGLINVVTRRTGCRPTRPPLKCGSTPRLWSGHCWALNFKRMTLPRPRCSSRLTDDGFSRDDERVDQGKRQNWRYGYGFRRLGSGAGFAGVQTISTKNGQALFSGTRPPYADDTLRFTQSQNPEAFFARWEELTGRRSVVALSGREPSWSWTPKCAPG